MIGPSNKDSTRTQVGSDTTEFELIEDGQSPESTQYAIPPTLYIEQFADPGTAKRGRQHLRDFRPVQQKKRHRQSQLANPLSPQWSTEAVTMSTGLSYRLEDHDSNLEADDLDDRTEVFSSDEEAIKESIEKEGVTNSKGF